MYLLPWNDDMNGVLLIALLWEVNKHVLSLRLAGTQVDSLLFFQYYSVHCLHIAFNRCLSRRARRNIVAISLPSSTPFVIAGNQREQLLLRHIGGGGAVNCSGSNTAHKNNGRT